MACNHRANHVHLYKTFHGKGSELSSNIDLFCNAAGPYRDFFESTELHIDTENASTSTSTRVVKYRLKEDLHCMGNANIISGKDLKTHILARSRMNGSKEIQGNTCLTRGKEVAANICIATAHAKKFWNTKTDSPMKS